MFHIFVIFHTFRNLLLFIFFFHFFTSPHGYCNYYTQKKQKGGKYFHSLAHRRRCPGRAAVAKAKCIDKRREYRGRPARPRGLLVGRRRIGQHGCSMGKRDYRQSGHINSSWSGAVSLPVLRWYHAASSQSPPIARLRIIFVFQV